MSNINEKNDSSSLSLQCLDNYNSIYSHCVEDVYKIFTSIIIHFIENAKKSIYIKNQGYLHYVIKNGINVLHNVFSTIYLYSKNLEMTKQYTEKGYYIYCEFIGKVGDNNHKFLNLNSKDATLFVLKKTIYEINNTYKRNFDLSQQEKDYINKLNGYTNSFINILMILFEINQLVNINYEESDYIQKNKTIVVFSSSILEKIKQSIIKNTIIKSNLTILKKIIDCNKDDTEKLKQIYLLIKFCETQTNIKQYNEIIQEKIFNNICNVLIQ